MQMQVVFACYMPPLLLLLLLLLRSAGVSPNLKPPTLCRRVACKGQFAEPLGAEAAGYKGE